MEQKKAININIANLIGSVIIVSDKAPETIRKTVTEAMAGALKALEFLQDQSPENLE